MGDLRIKEDHMKLSFLRIKMIFSDFVSFIFQFNFVGKLLGPKGNTLKRLQEETMTKMAILGRGSMRDKAKVGSE